MNEKQKAEAKAIDDKYRKRRSMVIMTGIAVFGTVGSAAESDGGRFMFTVLSLLGLK